jgi:ribonucleoside-diphosphate reductase alpha chain
MCQYNPFRYFAYSQVREKFGDDMVDQVKSGDTESCPTDPLLAKICPSCE